MYAYVRASVLLHIVVLSARGEKLESAEANWNIFICRSPSVGDPPRCTGATQKNKGGRHPFSPPTVFPPPLIPASCEPPPDGQKGRLPLRTQKISDPCINSKTQSFRQHGRRSHSTKLHVYKIVQVSPNARQFFSFEKKIRSQM